MKVSTPLALCVLTRPPQSLPMSDGCSLCQIRTSGGHGFTLDYDGDRQAYTLA
ncbi:MAG: hypothetical protein V7L01_07575 [Nostoc sp.]|uniref:hypothetical protein n=1 Tax=Nostoc sp. TaxID=1180 RepID=UPI002FFA880E